MRAKTKTLAAPVGGWNARDSLANMPELDAVSMEDAFPNTTDVQIRKGSTDHVTGITGKTVETLAAYNNATTKKLFASVDNNIYDVTSSGAVGSAESGTTVTNARWQHINFKVPSGNHWLIMANGTDSVLYYNGSAWSNETITGVTSANLIHVNEYKNRVWFVEKDSSSVWYLPTDAISGTVTELDLAPVFSEGGHLMAMATWSLDAGSGLDDHAVFISDRGQVAVYSGTDPSSATTWGLVGVFDIGSPVGRRCFMQFGGDLLIITQSGVVPLSKALLNAEISQAIAISDKIRLEMTRAVTSYQNNFGWQLVQYPNANMLLVNIPVSSSKFEQYVMNTITGSWCKFTGWNASCWELFDDEIYFGTSATVVKAWDDDDDNGSNITADIVPAFNYFGSFTQKRFTMARPIFSSTGTPGVLMGMNTDFSTTDPSGTPTLTSTAGDVWDTGVWDTAVWGGDFLIQRNWQSINGIGFSASLHLQMTTNAHEVRWLSYDVVYEDGAVI